MDRLWNGNIDEVVSGLVAVVLVMAIVMLIMMGKLRRLRKKLNAMLNGATTGNLEQAILETQASYKQLLAEQNELRGRSEQLEKQLKAMKTKVGVVRYNAFAEQGSDLSFSVAWVDEDRNGVVLSGLHGRSETYVYAKPLLRGQSTYPLSPEESVAIDRAANKSGDES